MKTLIIITLFSLAGKNASDSGISYRQLTWADFRGKVAEDRPEVGAESIVGLQIESVEDNGHFKFAVKALFWPYSSYVRVKTKEGLVHEQTHFKIVQIEALKCMLALEPLQGGDSADSLAAYALYYYHYHRIDSINTQFDAETDHCKNIDQEVDWENRVSHELRIFEILFKKSYGRNR